MSVPLNGTTASSAGGDPVSRAVQRKADLRSRIDLERMSRNVKQPKKTINTTGSNG